MRAPKPGVPLRGINNGFCLCKKQKRKSSARENDQSLVTRSKFVCSQEKTVSAAREKSQARKFSMEGMILGRTLHGEGGVK